MDDLERSRLKLDILHLAREHTRGKNADNEAPLGEIIKTAEIFYKFVAD
jgi:hypothetical protein